MKKQVKTTTPTASRFNDCDDWLTMPSRLNHDHPDALERFGGAGGYLQAVLDAQVADIVHGKLAPMNEKPHRLNMPITRQTWEALAEKADATDATEEELVRVALALFLGLNPRGQM